MTDDAKGTRGSSASIDADTPPAGAPAAIRSRLLTEIEPPTDIGFPNEADTLRTHGALKTLPRRDTTPVPPDDTASVEALDLDDDDILDDDDGFEHVPDDDTQVERRLASGDDITSPTLSLANQSDAAREVYRMFLASEYAPALELADELIAQGMNDPMLVTIARECRSSMAATISSAPPPPLRLLNDGAPRSGARPLGMFDGTTTIEEVARMTGTSVEQVVALLERFVTVLPVRPPR